MIDVPRKKVAIVGTGSAGIAALWALNRTHHDVYVYEAASRLGGHTNTVEWKQGKSCTRVDTGFMAMNSATYPNFINFLKAINIPVVPTDVTFSVSRDHGVFEWACASFDSFFCQRSNLLSPRMWRLLFDIARFNQFALDLLENDAAATSSAPSRDESIGQYLQREGYSDIFRNDYLIPLAAAVWSSKPDKRALEFPAVTLVRFLWSHHILSTIPRRSQWQTIQKGARTYVDVVIKGFPPNHLFLNTSVLRLTNDSDGRVRLHLEGGHSDVYDHVILATHGDEAYTILGQSATAEEADILSSFKTSENLAVLHADPKLLPTTRKAWSSCNYLSQTTTSMAGTASTASVDQVSLTYNMNMLQHIPADIFGNVLVTLNPLTEPDPTTVQGRYIYRHPVYTAAAVQAQKKLQRIQNTRGISYAGAWTKYGLHEDGFSSGLAVAVDHLGAKLPFAYVDSTYSGGDTPQRGVLDWLLGLLLWLVQVLFIVPVEKMCRVSRKLAEAAAVRPAKTKQQKGAKEGKAD